MRTITGMPRDWHGCSCSPWVEVIGEAVISLQTIGERMCMHCVINTIDHGHDVFHYCNG